MWGCTLAEENGLSPDLCSICGRPIRDGDTVQRGFDNTAAHLACLDTVDIDEEEDHAQD